MLIPYHFELLKVCSGSKYGTGLGESKKGYYKNLLLFIGWYSLSNFLFLLAAQSFQKQLTIVAEQRIISKGFERFKSR